MERWLGEYVAVNVKTSTRVSYENIAYNQIIPRLGHFRLTTLKKSHVNDFYQALLQNGRADGTGGLSIKTVRNVHIVLHRALREAETRGLVGANPATGANVPGFRNGTRKHAEALTLPEQRALTALCGKDAVGTAIVTALSTGLRMGELLGLRWCDVDFSAGTVSVSRQLSRLKDYTPGAEAKTRLSLEDGTKTGASTRVIPIDRALANRLLEYKAAQTAKQPPKPFNNKETAPPDMIFTGRGGSFLDPSAFRYHYRRMLGKAGMDRHTVHTLRHTFATRALEAGVPVKAVSQIMGHAGSRITMDTYSHILPVFQAEAMTRIARYIEAS
jgi:integrase